MKGGHVVMYGGSMQVTLGGSCAFVSISSLVETSHQQMNLGGARAEIK